MSLLNEAPMDAIPVPRDRARHRSVWKRHGLGIVGTILVTVAVLAALVGPLLLEVGPNEQNLAARLLPPLSQGPEYFHVLGTDNIGRDILSRLLIGARGSLGVAAIALFLGGALGIAVGILSGLVGGWLDVALMRLTDAQLAVPNLIAAMFISAVLGTGYWKTAVTLAIATWPLYARLMRAEVLKIREEDYISSAIGLGSSGAWLVYRHVLPNLMSSIMVLGTLELGGIILAESSLSYLGFGVQPPDPSLGGMISEGQVFVFTDPWLSIAPGIMILMIALGLNLVGDWLRDLLDPHTQTS